MAKLYGITLPAGWDIIYNKTLKMYDISVMCNVGLNPRWQPRARFVALKEISYLFTIAQTWGALTADQKSEWNFAANVIGTHNYNLYVQDKSYRIKHAITGDATPSLYHQYLVGYIDNMLSLYVQKLTQYNFTKLVFPCSVEICVQGDFARYGGDGYLRINFIYNLYIHGQTIEVKKSMDIEPSVWDKYKMWIDPPVAGKVGKWRIEIEWWHCFGAFWFDNVIVEYGGEIRTLDPFCENVVQYWKREGTVINGNFSTVYPPDEL